MKIITLYSISISLLIKSCSKIHRSMKKTIDFDKSTKYLKINQLNFDRIFSKYIINSLTIFRNLMLY